MPGTSDQENADSFGAMLTNLLPELRQNARSFLRGRADAEDLTQQTLLNAWQGRDRFQKGSSLQAWLFVIMRNAFYSRMRRDRRTVPLCDGQVGSYSETGILAAVELGQIRRMAHLLPEMQEKAFYAAMGGLSCKETARFMGCSEGAAKSQVARLRQRLRSSDQSAGRGPS